MTTRVLLSAAAAALGAEDHNSHIFHGALAARVGVNTRTCFARWKILRADDLGKANNH